MSVPGPRPIIPLRGKKRPVLDLGLGEPKAEVLTLWYSSVFPGVCKLEAAYSVDDDEWCYCVTDAHKNTTCWVGSGWAALQTFADICLLRSTEIEARRDRLDFLLRQREIWQRSVNEAKASIKRTKARIKELGSKP